METTREIKFVLTGAEIRLLMEADAHFAAEFCGKTLGERYEFTYTREALESLSFHVTGYAWFTAPERDRHKFDKIVEKLQSLRKLSDTFFDLPKEDARRRF